MYLREKNIILKFEDFNIFRIAQWFEND